MTVLADDNPSLRILRLGWYDLFELNKTAGRNARSNKQVRMHEQLASPIRSRGRSADLIEIHSSRQPNCESVVRIALSLIQGKWKIAILAQLEHGPIRFGELRRRVPGASKKMLTQHLRELEAGPPVP